MATIFFISDLHLGHKPICKFSRGLRTGNDCVENMNHLITNWNNVVHKRDLVWVLGDVAFSEEGFEALKLLKGRKKLVRGNHDNHFKTQDWLKCFESVEGMLSYKGYWLSHCPIHPVELRDKKNIHGHVHGNSVLLEDGTYDPRYINVCCEAINEIPIPFDDIRSGEYYNLRKC